MHSVFGRPAAARELFAPGAREMAERILSTLPEIAASNVMIARSLEIIHASLWAEFAKPYLNNAATPEGCIFWKALESTSPELAAEARRSVETGRVHASRLENAAWEACVASRAVFLLRRHRICCTGTVFCCTGTAFAAQAQYLLHFCYTGAAFDAQAR